LKTTKQNKSNETVTILTKIFFYFWTKAANTMVATPEKIHYGLMPKIEEKTRKILPFKKEVER
jgi:hypothetical protein